MEYHLKAISVCERYSHKDIAYTDYDRDQLIKAWLSGKRIFQSDHIYAGSALKIHWTASTVSEEERK